MEHTVNVTEKDAGQRLDVFCVAHFPNHSRASLQKAIKLGSITVNDHIVKPRYEIKAGDQVHAQLAQPPATPAQEMPELKLDVVYEDKEIIAVDKPPGILVHPAPGLAGPTVVDWLLGHHPEVAGVGEDNLRPGIVHRLDQDTSGVLVAAKTPKAYAHLKAQFKKHHAKKEYLALVFGIPTGDDGRINQAIVRSKKNPSRRAIAPPKSDEGRAAITEWTREEILRDRYALLRVFPLTGRTHQIRVHLHHIGHPIIGDKLYVFKRQHPPAGVKRQLLHAEKLTIHLLGGKRKTITAPLAPDFQNVLETLGYDLSGSH